MLTWLVFIVSAAAVIVAGARLSLDGDAIAQRTKLGAAFVGAVLVAAATSLPELATTSIAVLRGSAGLAMGDLFGTLMVNMAMLGLAVLIAGRAGVLSEVSPDQAITAALAAVLAAIAVLGIFAGGAPAVLGVGWAALGIGAAYLGGIWLLSRGRPPPPAETARAEEAREEDAEEEGLRPILIRFPIASAVILAGAYFLTGAARDLSSDLGVAESLFGVALLGLVTSLPEASVAFASVLRGAYGIGMGALLGSNAFDVLILLPLDVLDGPGALLGRADAPTSIAALFAIVLMGIVVIGIIHRGDRRIGPVDPIAVVLLGVYAIGLGLAFGAGTG